MVVSHPDFSVLPADLIHLRNRCGEQAVISRYGAQLLSWQSPDGAERLYCSPLLPTVPGAPIRGGVPVCFPQFSGRGPLPKHGLVRTEVWQADTSHASHDGAPPELAQARLWLCDSAATRALWPQQFRLQLEVTLGSGWLSIALSVCNCGPQTLPFTAALHTYLATREVRTLGVAGLQGVTFIDTAQQQARAMQSEALLQIADETDRIYLSPPAVLQLQQCGQPLLQIEQQGFADSVVWNPGPAKAAQLGDMPAADWSRMLCIEAAQVAEPIQLAPQASWRGQQRLSVLSC